MSNYYYLDVELKLREDAEANVTAAFFQGSIEQSLKSFFGEIGGQTDLELHQFDAAQKRAIIKVPTAYYKRACSAISLIGHYQNIPCHFKINKTSTEPLGL